MVWFSEGNANEELCALEAYGAEIRRRPAEAQLLALGVLLWVLWLGVRDEVVEQGQCRTIEGWTGIVTSQQTLRTGARPNVD